MFSFVQSRPPLVLFFLCIFTLTVTLFCYAFYIRNTNPIPDTDRKYDWLQLLRHFNALDYCLDSPGNIESREVVQTFIDTTTVQTVVSIHSTDYEKFTKAQGVLTLDGWHSDCQKNYAKPKNLLIYFDVPELTRVNSTKVDVCVIIRGPEEYLPKFSVPNCNTTVAAQSMNVPNEQLMKTAFFNSGYKNDETFCKMGSLTQLGFDLHVKDNFANFLSDNEKNLIYIHLLWTSYFLVFILLLIIIYGTLQSDNIYNKWVLFRNN